MGILSSFLSPFVKILRQPVESFIRLETSDDEMTFASSDGSLMTLVRVDGARQIIGDAEYKKILDDCVVKFGARFDRPGHALQIYFVRNPERIGEEIRLLLRPNREAARNIGLEIDDIFDERARNLGRYVAHEEIYFVLWTRPVILTKADFAREKEHARKRKWVVAPGAQYPFAAVEALRTRHKSFINAIMPALKEMGIQAATIEVHEAMRIMRINLFQGSADSDWKACLPGDPIPPRAQESRGDVSELLWPPLPQQLASVSGRIINDHMVEMGRHVWGGVDMVLGPQDPLPFPALLNRLAENRTPFRMSILLEGGGVQGMALQSFLSSVLAVTNPENKQVKDSLEGLSVMSRSEPVVKIRASFCTWAPKNNHDLLEDRVSELMQAVESWGYCQVSQLSGDPLDCVMSSALGIACASTAPPGIAPLHEVMRLLPWQRASSPFEKGSILFRTTDGRVWPYQTGTNVTTTWFDLVLAQPGGGKSVLMNTLNLGTCLSAGVS
ncbi:MAG: type IV secretion protein IcmB, partial [Alphaproteobacteria bacterium]|nr:type IV secretion protein IcmB [Alphaproteobacteria bacterium]